MAVFHPDESLLRAQISSLKQQSLRRWTCHMVIDGADERTDSLLRAIVGSDDRFKVHHMPENVGFYANFERAVRLALPGAQWVALSDQDDVWDTDKLERLVPLIRGNVTGVMCQARLVNVEGAVTGRTDRRMNRLPSLIFDNQITGSLSVFRSDIVEAALPFPAPTSSAYHDHWLGLVAAVHGRFVILDEVLQSYVQHGGNVLGEETGGRMRARFTKLASGGFRQSLDVLAIDRWGWRKTMVDTLAQRFSDSQSPALSEVIHAASGVHPALSAARGVIAHEIPPLRAAGLVAGWGITWVRSTQKGLS
ncbi:hypothetical protein GCM10027579_12250 [Calidifontibacter terrae]